MYLLCSMWRGCRCALLPYTHLPTHPPFTAFTQGSGLPSLLQSKLNAPRVLRVNKVGGCTARFCPSRCPSRCPTFVCKPCHQFHPTCTN